MCHSDLRAVQSQPVASRFLCAFQVVAILVHRTFFTWLACHEMRHEMRHASPPQMIQYAAVPSTVWFIHVLGASSCKDFSAFYTEYSRYAPCPSLGTYITCQFVSLAGTVLLTGKATAHAALSSIEYWS